MLGNQQLHCGKGLLRLLLFLVGGVCQIISTPIIPKNIENAKAISGLGTIVAIHTHFAFEVLEHSTYRLGFGGGVALKGMKQHGLAVINICY